MQLTRWTLLGLLTLSIAGAALCAAARAQDKPASTSKTPGDELIGEWWTENNEGRVQFARYRDGTYRGTTTCCVPKVETKDRPKLDYHNPKPELRTRSTIGIVIIWKLAYQGKGSFTGGYVYNPRDGDTYHMNVEVIDADTIKIRGFMGIELLGQSQVWKRARPGAAPPPTAAK